METTEHNLIVEPNDSIKWRKNHQNLFLSPKFEGKPSPVGMYFFIM